MAKEIGYDFSGVDAAKNNHDLYGLRYAEFVVPLVKAVQELSQQNEELASKFTTQQKNYETKIDGLQKQIDELKSLLISQNNGLIRNRETASK